MTIKTDYRILQNLAEFVNISTDKTAIFMVSKTKPRNVTRNLGKMGKEKNAQRSGGVEGAVDSLEDEIKSLKDDIEEMTDSFGEISIRLKDIEDKMLRIEIAIGTIPDRKK